MASMSKALSEPAGSVRIRTPGTRLAVDSYDPGLRPQTRNVSRTSQRCWARRQMGHAPFRYGFRGGEQASSLSANASASSDVGVRLADVFATVR